MECLVQSFLKRFAQKMANSRYEEDLLTNAYHATAEEIKERQPKLYAYFKNNEEANLSSLCKFHFDWKLKLVQEVVTRMRSKNENVVEIIEDLVATCKTCGDFDRARKMLLTLTSTTDRFTDILSGFMSLFESHLEFIAEMDASSETMGKFLDDFFITMLHISGKISETDMEDVKKLTDVLCALFSIYIESKLNHSPTKHFNLVTETKILFGNKTSSLLDSLAQVSCDACNSKVMAGKHLKGLYHEVLISTRWRNESTDVYLRICLTANQAIQFYTGANNSLCQVIKNKLAKLKPSKDFFQTFQGAEDCDELMKTVADNSKNLTRYLIEEADAEAIKTLLNACLAKMKEKEEKVSANEVKDQEVAEDDDEEALFVVDKHRADVDSDDEDDDDEVTLVGDDVEELILDLTDDDDDDDADFSGFSPRSDQDEEAMEGEEEKSTSNQEIEVESMDDDEEAMEGKEEKSTSNQEIEVESMDDDEEEVQKAPSKKKLFEDEVIVVDSDDSDEEMQVKQASKNEEIEVLSDDDDDYASVMSTLNDEEFVEAKEEQAVVATTADDEYNEAEDEDYKPEEEAETEDQAESEHDDDDLLTDLLPLSQTIKDDTDEDEFLIKSKILNEPPYSVEDEKVEQVIAEEEAKTSAAAADDAVEEAKPADNDVPKVHQRSSPVRATTPEPSSHQTPKPFQKQAPHTASAVQQGKKFGKKKKTSQMS